MKLLKEMIKEEWRMHSELFGSRAFALFPFAILLLTGFLVFAFYVTGFSLEQMLLGINVLLFFMGLNVGSLGFIGKDAAENLLGAANLLIFSSRTLPVGQKKIIVNFVAKDLLYYTFMLVTPVVLGLLALKPLLPLTAATLGLAWVAGIEMFMLGVGLSFLGASLYNRRKAYAGALVVLIFAAGLYMGGGLLEYTPLSLLQDASVNSFLAGFVPLAILNLLGLRLYLPESRRAARTSEDRFQRLNELLEGPLVTRSFLDLERSSGGLWKLVFSQAVVFGFFAFMMTQLVFLEAISSAPGMIFSLIMAISSITTYNWLTRFDDLEEYLRLPVSIENVFEAKMKLFLGISVPVAWTFIVLGSVFFGMDGVVPGMLSLPLTALYVLGVTVYFAGMDPNNMLFSAGKFLKFVALIGLGLVPLFIAAMLYPVYQVNSVLAYMGGSVLLGLIGYWLFNRGVRHWSSRSGI
ncbi:MAG: hypothetical protein ABEJ69_02915 [Candidatus Nanohaloarchaea archaeon]